MKIQNIILSLLMIVILFIAAALPVAADTVLTTNDGTVLVCDDNGNCQIAGQVNNNINNKDYNIVYTSNSDSDGIDALKLLGIGIIFSVMGLIMRNMVEKDDEWCNPAPKQFAYGILILGLGMVITSFIIVFSEGFAAVGMHLIFG